MQSVMRESGVTITFPKWVACNVRDWDALWVTLSDGSVDLNEATAAVINYMPVIGVLTPTEEAAPDAWCRIAVHQALFDLFVH